MNNNDPMIAIVFGLAGAGKTYVGKVMHEHFGFYHADADAWLPEKMKNYITENKLFTLDMLHDFVEIIIANVAKLKEKHPRLVITQALYRQKNRQQIQRAFAECNLQFIQVDADDAVIMQRIIARSDWIEPNYAFNMRQYFQSTPSATVIFNNENGAQHIIQQLHSALGENN